MTMTAVGFDGFEDDAADDEAEEEAAGAGAGGEAEGALGSVDADIGASGADLAFSSCAKPPTTNSTRHQQPSAEAPPPR